MIVSWPLPHDWTVLMERRVLESVWRVSACWESRPAWFDATEVFALLAQST